MKFFAQWETQEVDFYETTSISSDFEMLISFDYKCFRISYTYFHAARVSKSSLLTTNGILLIDLSNN